MDFPTISLKTPLPTTTTQAVGIFQDEIIVQTAIRAAIADLRANQYLLQYVFGSLAVDTVSLAKYGEKDRGSAIKWFNSSKIDVMMGHIRPPEGPPTNCVSIELQGSDEQESRLGDVHYFPREDLDAQNSGLTPLFTPTSYDPLAGLVTISPNIANSIQISTAMALVDHAGVAHQILDVVTEKSFKIDPQYADLQGCYIRSSLPTFVTHVESASFAVSYRIGCHAIGEPVNLAYLHSIIVFALLRYRQPLLEARGLTRTKISSSGVSVSEGLDSAQPYYSRNITLSGFVENSWPAQISERILSEDVVSHIVGGNRVPIPDGQTLDDQSILGDLDADPLAP